MSAEEFVPVSDEAHEHHCKLAGCKHPAVHRPLGLQGWCARCRAVAFPGAVYQGLVYRGGQIVAFDGVYEGITYRSGQLVEVDGA